MADVVDYYRAIFVSLCSVTNFIKYLSLS